MRKMIAIFLVAFYVLLANGCKSKIQIIHNDNVVTNNVTVKAFNDESYIWENWQFSTNEVKQTTIE